MIPTEPVEDIDASSSHIRKPVFIDESSRSKTSEATVFSVFLTNFFPETFCHKLEIHLCGLKI
jgi:hypothetical protein